VLGKIGAKLADTAEYSWLLVLGRTGEGLKCVWKYVVRLGLRDASYHSDNGDRMRLGDVETLKFIRERRWPA